jgi:hypothetical protein
VIVTFPLHKRDTGHDAVLAVRSSLCERRSGATATFGGPPSSGRMPNLTGAPRPRLGPTRHTDLMVRAMLPRPELVAAEAAASASPTGCGSPVDHRIPWDRKELRRRHANCHQWGPPIGRGQAPQSNAPTTRHRHLAPGPVIRLDSKQSWLHRPRFRHVCADSWRVVCSHECLGQVVVEVLHFEVDDAQKRCQQPCLGKEVFVDHC